MTEHKKPGVTLQPPATTVWRLFAIQHQSLSTVELDLWEKEPSAIVIYEKVEPMVLAERLKRAVRQARASIFIIQAENDYSVEPAKVLGSELEKKGSPNHAKIYPSFGNTTQDGHWGFGARRDGITLWAPDVETFLDVTMNPAVSH